MSDPHLIQAHLFIAGTVQGVSYRAYTHQMATKVGISGWVKNLPDGRVEAMFEGTQSQVEQAVQWCHGGSPAAVVREVDVVYESPTGCSGFEIRYL